MKWIRKMIRLFNFSLKDKKRKIRRNSEVFFLIRIILNGTEIIAEILLPSNMYIVTTTAKFYLQFFLQLTRSIVLALQQLAKIKLSPCIQKYPLCYWNNEESANSKRYFYPTAITQNLSPHIKIISSCLNISLSFRANDKKKKERNTRGEGLTKDYNFKKFLNFLENYLFPEIEFSSSRLNR